MLHKLSFHSTGKMSETYTRLACNPKRNAEMKKKKNTEIEHGGERFPLVWNEPFLKADWLFFIKG